MQHLRDIGKLDETLIVLTTDHAGQPSKRFHGVDGAGRGDFNWYYGDDAERHVPRSRRRRSQPLIATGNVRFSYQDSAIRTWLTDTRRRRSAKPRKVMATLPDVIASYRLDASERRYRLERRTCTR